MSGRADGKTIQRKDGAASFDFGSVAVGLAILGAIIYFGSVILLGLFLGVLIFMLRGTTQRKSVQEARSSHARVAFDRCHEGLLQGVRRNRELQALNLKVS